METNQPKILILGDADQTIFLKPLDNEKRIDRIVEELIQFIKYNPDDLINRKLLRKVIKRGFIDCIENPNNFEFPLNLNFWFNFLKFFKHLGISTDLIITFIKENWMVVHQEEIVPFTNKDFKNIRNCNYKYIFIPIISEAILSNIKISNLEDSITFSVLYSENIPNYLLKLEYTLDILFIDIRITKLNSTSHSNIERIDNLLKSKAKLRIYYKSYDIITMKSEGLNFDFILPDDLKPLSINGFLQLFTLSFVINFYNIVENESGINFINNFNANNLIQPLLNRCCENDNLILNYLRVNKTNPLKKNIKEFIRTI